MKGPKPNDPVGYILFQKDVWSKNNIIGDWDTRWSKKILGLIKIKDGKKSDYNLEHEIRKTEVLLVGLARISIEPHISFLQKLNKLPVTRASLVSSHAWYQPLPLAQ